MFFFPLIGISLRLKGKNLQVTWLGATSHCLRMDKWPCFNLLIAAYGAGHCAKNFPCVLSLWEVDAQEEMGVAGVKWPAQACIASARQSRDWNPGVSCIEATVLTPTICPYPAAVAASCGLSNRWFLLWSYFCFHFLSAITFGNHERELTCYSQSKIWGLCRVERLFPVWAAGILTKGETKSWRCLWWAPPPPTHTHGEVDSKVRVPCAAASLPSSPLMVLFCLPFILSPEAFHQLLLLSLLRKNSANLYQSSQPCRESEFRC